MSEEQKYITGSTYKKYGKSISMVAPPEVFYEMCFGEGSD
jgi:hypothetical protein